MLDTTTATKLTAPEGARVYSVWIWLYFAFGSITLLPLLAWDPRDYIRRSFEDPLFALLAPVTSPWFWAWFIGTWVMYGFCVACAYWDWRWLESEGVRNPFHWAWTFLSASIYPIGRSVICVKRTGRGIAPLWAEVGLLIVGTVVTTYLMVVITAEVATQVAELFKDLPPLRGR